MELYQYLKEKYNNCSLKSEINFNEFIEGFMNGTFYTSAEHEVFWFDEDFLGTFTMSYKIDHDKEEIKLLFQ